MNLLCYEVRRYQYLEKEAKYCMDEFKIVSRGFPSCLQNFVELKNGYAKSDGSFDEKD